MPIESAYHVAPCENAFFLAATYWIRLRPFIAMALPHGGHHRDA
jgi:hypothetical protein